MAKVKKPVEEEPKEPPPSSASTWLRPSANFVCPHSTNRCGVSQVGHTGERFDVADMRNVTVRGRAGDESYVLGWGYGKSGQRKCLQFLWLIQF